MCYWPILTCLKVNRHEPPPLEGHSKASVLFEAFFLRRSGDINLEEHELTEKQRKWLEASQRIGPGAMTKTERQLLERLYADMLPREQQELAAYIEAKFGKGTPDSKESEEKDPIEKMRRKEWSPPSEALRSALSKSQTRNRGL